MGKGFAVVANEVKELATSSSRATEEISQQIETLQCDAEKAVAAIKPISNTILEIADTQNTIAAAVEEQTATTQDIAKSANIAAERSSSITDGVAQVSSASDEAAQVSSVGHRASAQLTGIASDLSEIMGRFKT